MTAGIVTGHAYSVLQVYEADGLRLVELRNPWGRGEWEGDWSDSSKKWGTEEVTFAQRHHSGPGYLMVMSRAVDRAQSLRDNKNTPGALVLSSIDVS